MPQQTSTTTTTTTSLLVNQQPSDIQPSSQQRNSTVYTPLLNATQPVSLTWSERIRLGKSFPEGVSKTYSAFGTIAILYYPGYWLCAPVFAGGFISFANEVLEYLKKRHPNHRTQVAANVAEKANEIVNFCEDWGFTDTMLVNIAAQIGGPSFYSNYFAKYIGPGASLLPAVLIRHVSYNQAHGKTNSTALNVYSDAMRAAYSPTFITWLLSIQGIIPENSYIPLLTSVFWGALGLILGVAKHSKNKTQRKLATFLYHLLIVMVAEKPSLAAIILAIPNNIYAAAHQDEIPDLFFFSTVAFAAVCLAAFLWDSAIDLRSQMQDLNEEEEEERDAEIGMITNPPSSRRLQFNNFDEPFSHASSDKSEEEEDDKLSSSQQKEEQRSHSHELPFSMEGNGTSTKNKKQTKTLEGQKTPQLSSPATRKVDSQPLFELMSLEELLNVEEPFSYANPDESDGEAHEKPEKKNRTIRNHSSQEEHAPASRNSDGEKDDKLSASKQKRKQRSHSHDMPFPMDSSGTSTERNKTQTETLEAQFSSPITRKIDSQPSSASMSPKELKHVSALPFPKDENEKNIKQISSLAVEEEEESVAEPPFSEKDILKKDALQIRPGSLVPVTSETPADTNSTPKKDIELTIGSFGSFSSSEKITFFREHRGSSSEYLPADLNKPFTLGSSSE